MPTHRLKALCAAVLATAALSFGADTPKPDTSAPTRPAEKPAATPVRTNSALKTEGPTVVLPQVEVRQSRLREIDVTIKKLEKQISREKKQLEKSNLDEVLNSEKVAKAASIFGGKSTVQRASVIAVRIDSMEKELNLLETLRTPLLPADRALIEKEVQEQQAYRRQLDDALR